MGSGRFGVVNGVNVVENFVVNDSKEAQSYVASNTRQGTARGGGVRDWNGTFQGKGGTPSVMPNQEFQFEGYTEPDNGQEGGVGLTYVGPAIVRSVTVTWDWTSNELLTWSAVFAGKPGLTTPTQVPTLDLSAPSDEYSCGTFFEYDDPGVEIPALTTATLTITANLFESANSSTRAGGECFIDRGPGAIDWTLSATQEDKNRGIAGYPDLGEDLQLKLYTKPKGADEEFWTLDYGRLLSYNNLRVDMSSSTPISRQLNLGMQAAIPVDGLGKIVVPGGNPTTPWWGQA